MTYVSKSLITIYNFRLRIAAILLMRCKAPINQFIITITFVAENCVILEQHFVRMKKLNKSCLAENKDGFHFQTSRVSLKPVIILNNNR